MGTPNKDRQRKWKEKQTAEGKKAVTVMLSERAKDLIDRECKKTDETIADVIERAIANLFGVVTSNKEWYKLPPSKLTGKQKEIIRKVNRRRYGLFMNPSEIAGIYNKRSVPTLTGAAQWDEAEVQLILDYLKKDNLGVQLRLGNGKWEGFEIP
jgi:hypothetical protein